MIALVIVVQAINTMHFVRQSEVILTETELDIKLLLIILSSSYYFVLGIKHRPLQIHNDDKW
jgi:hypothetical protein